MRRRLMIWAILLSLSGAVHAEDAAPRLELDESLRLVLSDLPAVLADPEVERHLESGLTTSLVLEARLQRPQIRGVARVDIRFELWDEVFLVTVIDGEGGVSTLEPASREDLRSWWSEARIALSGPLQRTLERATQARLSVLVVPFSQSELVDAQRWLSESMTQGGAGPGGDRSGSGAVGALIATSIQRRAVRRMTWSVEVTHGENP